MGRQCTPRAPKCIPCGSVTRSSWLAVRGDRAGRISRLLITWRCWKWANSTRLLMLLLLGWMTGAWGGHPRMMVCHSNKHSSNHNSNHNHYHHSSNSRSYSSRVQQVKVRVVRMGGLGDRWQLPMVVEGYGCRQRIGIWNSTLELSLRIGNETCVLTSWCTCTRALMHMVCRCRV